MPYKIILLGDTMVGKSSLVIRYVFQTISDRQCPTIGAAMFSKYVNTPKFRGHLNIWDTAGQERYKSLAPLYYRGAHIALVLYDITYPTSFMNAKQCIQRLQLSENPLIALIGNKTDLTEMRAVEYEEGDKWAQENGVFFFETSIMDDSTDVVFDTLLAMLPSEPEQQLEPVLDIIQTKSRCC
jgi:small GTP-binding protein